MLGGRVEDDDAEGRVVGQGLARELCRGVPRSTYVIKILVEELPSLKLRVEMTTLENKSLEV